VQDKMQVKSAQ